MNEYRQMTYTRTSAEDRAQDRLVREEQAREKLTEAELTPSVQEALDRARSLPPEALNQAVAQDKATAANQAWSARDYAAQRLVAIRGLQQLIDARKMLGKDTAEFETSLRAESDRLARFLLTKEQWAEPENEIEAVEALKPKQEEPPEAK